MLSSHFRIAIRNQAKRPLFSAINVLGLTLGIAASSLLLLFITGEYGYDRYNDKADRIYRITSDLHINGNTENTVFGPAPMGPALLTDNPKIESCVRIRYIPDMPVMLDRTKVTESGAVFADPAFFDIFTIPMLQGNPHTALAAPHSMVISETIAKKYFHTTDVLGRTMTTDDSSIYTITGLIKDMPAQSHFHFGFIKSMTEKRFDWDLPWINFFSATYLLAKPGVSAGDIDKMLAAAVTKYIGPQVQQAMHSSLADMAKNGDYFRFYAMPLTRIHLHSHVKGEFETNGDSQTVNFLVLITAFILLIAGFNFINLSTARSADRSKETGIRKILGSTRSRLLAAFLTESVLLCLIAALLAMLMATLLIPALNGFTDRRYPLTTFLQPWPLLAFLSGSIVLGLLAGIYPAVFLSSFQPVQAVKSTQKTGYRNSWLRNSLVVCQFGIAIFLLIGTLVMYRQLDYIRHRNPGYNRDQVLTVGNTRLLGEQAAAFEQEAAKLPGITGATMTGFLPGKVFDGARGYFKDASARTDATYLLGSWKIDADYIPLLQMQMLGGRNFSSRMPTDSACVLINETAARLLGYTHPVSEYIYTGPDPLTKYRILGLVKDFDAPTPHSRIEPVVFHLGSDNRAVSFRLGSANIPGLIAQIKRIYQSMDKTTGRPFTYTFMDEDFDRSYRADRRTGEIFIVFTILAIFIACLGLFGLVSYAAEQRTKEIGIRKILGAGTRSILALLTGDFLRLVVIALLLACPLAWWYMHHWLENFTTRIAIDAWTFLLAAAAALLIAILTTGFQALRAASANPAESCRL